MSSVNRQGNAFCARSRTISLASFLTILCIPAIFLISAGCGQALALQAGNFELPTPIIYATGGQNTVSVIDVNNGRLLGALPGYRMPSHVTASPDGRRAYVLEPGDKSIAVVDTSTNTPIARISLDIDPENLALSSDGTRIYVTGGDDTLSIIDAATGTGTGTIKVGTLPDGICVNPATGDIYVLSRWDKSVSVVRGNSVAATLALDGYLDTDMAISPDGSRLYVPDHYSKVYVIDTAGCAVLSNFSTGENSGPVSVAVSPGGDYVYVACASAGSIRKLSTSNYELAGTYSVPSPDRLITDRGGRALYALTSNGFTVMDGVYGGVLYTVGVNAYDMSLAKVTGTFTLPDVTPPVSTLTVTGPLDLNAANIGEAACTFTAVDNEGGTGVKSIEYRLPEREWTTYSGAFNITVPGTYAMYYRSIDNAGNIEPDRAYIVHIVSLQDAVTPRPVACPTPSPTPKAASPTPTPVPVAASATPAATQANAGQIPVATPAATPATAATPTSTPVPSAGFESVAAFIGVLCAGYALAARKR